MAECPTKTYKKLILIPTYIYPTNTGGKVVFKEHARDWMSQYGSSADIAYLNVDDDPINSSDAGNVFSRAAPKFSRHNFISSIIQEITILPRAIRVRRNNILLKYITQNWSSYDEIFIDHLCALGMLPEKFWKSDKIILISHNIETDILQQQAESEESIIKKLFLWIEHFRMKIVEKKIMRSTKLVYFLSARDLERAQKLNWRKPQQNSKVLPFYLESKNTWRAANIASRSFLFVGGSNYFPNYDAIEWLCESLATDLPDFTFNIVGSCDNFIADCLAKNLNIPINVIFHGKVSEEFLFNLYSKSSAFICPVVLGSGIKIKILEAASHALPIFSTAESLFGLEHIIGVKIFDRNDSKGSAILIQKLFEQPECVLVKMSNLTRESVTKLIRSG